MNPRATPNSNSAVTKLVNPAQGTVGDPHLYDGLVHEDRAVYRSLDLVWSPLARKVSIRHGYWAVANAIEMARWHDPTHPRTPNFCESQGLCTTNPN